MRTAWWRGDIVRLSVAMMASAYFAYDALLMRLPLLGGDGVLHDWNHILGTLHLLRDTPHIGYGIYSIGALTICGAAISSLLVSQSATQKL